MFHTVVDSPLGPLTLVADDEGRLAGLYMEDQRYRPADERFGAAVVVRTASDAGAAGPDAPSDPAARAQQVLGRTADQLDEYFAGRRRTLDVPRAPLGTEFQRSVWDALARIPYGETRTYAEVAEELGRPSAVRAVGAAIGRNPLCVVVPCHRVVGSGGALTGYAGGLVRKRQLLDLESPAVNASASAS